MDFCEVFCCFFFFILDNSCLFECCWDKVHFPYISKNLLHTGPTSVKRKGRWLDGLVARLINNIWQSIDLMFSPESCRILFCPRWREVTKLKIVRLRKPCKFTKTGFVKTKSCVNGAYEIQNIGEVMIRIYLCNLWWIKWKIEAVKWDSWASKIAENGPNCAKNAPLLKSNCHESRKE